MSKALKDYSEGVSQKKVATPQTERTPGRTDEVKNNAGGFVFTVSARDRLERFLILGTDGGTYYVGEADLTKKNVDFIKALIKTSERLVVDTVLDVSTNNRAAKQSPAIFVLAMVLSEGSDKAYAREAVNKVVRTSTHLFEFAEYVKAFGGWGRSKRAAVAGWYEDKDAQSLAYQAVKYRQRNGWTHRDLFRLSHPKGVDRNVGAFILGKGGDNFTGDSELIDAFHEMQRSASVKDVLAALNENKNLPWETIPTQFLTEPEVWKTLFYNGALGQTALLRNVTRFAKNGAFKDVKFAGDVAKALADKERILKGRVHPVAYANALGIYRDGQFVKERDGYGSSQRVKSWTTNAKVAGALEAGFMDAFQTVTPSNRRTMISIDTSGSMTWGAPAGLVGLDYMGAAALMAMVTVRTEPYVEVNGFSTSLRSLNISDTDSFAEVDRKVRRGGYGGTDCSLPMAHARDNGLDFDTFMVFTDNETWAGVEKPSQALVSYRRSSGNDARLAVVAFAGGEFSIADPTMPGLMMDFVGFDAAAPRVLSEFSAGRL